MGTTNYVAWCIPTGLSVSLGLFFPNTTPTANQFLLCGNTSGGISSCVWTTFAVANLTGAANNTLPKGNGTGGLVSSSITDDGTVIKTGENLDLQTNSLLVELANCAASCGHGGTGTVLNKIAVLVAVNPSTVTLAGTGDTTGGSGIVIGGAGTTGNAQIAREGEALCVFDGATTASDYVQMSPTVAGDCHDAGAAVPASGQIFGRVLSTNGAGGTYNMTIAPPHYGGGASGGLLGDPGSNGVVIRTALNTTTARTITGTSPITVTNGDGTAGNPTIACATCAPLNSPTFTGTPAAPTQTAGDNTTALATDAFVTTAINNAIAGVNPAVAVLAASTANVVGTYSNGVAGVGATFTVTATGAFSLDGVAINTIGQRVLLKNQSTAFQNGIYTATIVGAVAVSPVFTRALDYDQPSDINSTGAIPVQSGTVNALTSWLLTSTVNTVGTDALTYAQFSISPTVTTQLIATGSTAFATASIPGNSCATTITVAATGATVATDRITWTPNADISGVTGYGVLSTDGLKVYSWLTAGNINFHVCNGTGTAIVPGAVTAVWGVTR
jgi:hypothetical protein